MEDGGVSCVPTHCRRAHRCGASLGSELRHARKRPETGSGSIRMKQNRIADGHRSVHSAGLEVLGHELDETIDLGIGPQVHIEPRKTVCRGSSRSAPPRSDIPNDARMSQPIDGTVPEAAGITPAVHDPHEGLPSFRHSGGGRAPLAATRSSAHTTTTPNRRHHPKPR